MPDSGLDCRMCALVAPQNSATLPPFFEPLFPASQPAACAGFCIVGSGFGVVTHNLLSSYSHSVPHKAVTLAHLRAVHRGSSATGEPLTEVLPLTSLHFFKPHISVIRVRRICFRGRRLYLAESRLAKFDFFTNLLTFFLILVLIKDKVADLFGN